MPDRRELLKILRDMNDEEFSSFVIWASTAYVPLNDFQGNPGKVALREAAKEYIDEIRKGRINAGS